MKKFIKLSLLLTTTWTVAELVTMWRMQDPRIPFKKFLKDYVNAIPGEYRKVHNASEEFWYGDREAGKQMLKDGLFLAPEQI